MGSPAAVPALQRMGGGAFHVSNSDTSSHFFLADALILRKTIRKRSSLRGFFMIVRECALYAPVRVRAEGGLLRRERKI